MRTGAMYALYSRAHLLLINWAERNQACHVDRRAFLKLEDVVDGGNNLSFFRLGEVKKLLLLLPSEWLRLLLRQK